MSTATLHLAPPTRFERFLQQLAEGLSRHVAHRIRQRTRRRQLALELLRQQQVRRHDARDVDHLLAMHGVSRRSGPRS